MARKYVIRISIALVVAVAAFMAVFLALVQFIPFDTSRLQDTSSPTVIYAGDGSVLAKINGPGSSSLPYADLPSDLKNAVVATEDHTFWNSSSIDVRGILRAAFVDLWTRSLAQGGSTIQEQLAKIVYLNDQKTFKRKIKQVILGVQINRHFTKQEILDMYMNQVYLGEDSVGVEQAAERYFGVNLHAHPQLTLDQAALLAGLPQAPSYYDPLQNPKAAMARRNQVLQNMVTYKYISAATAAKAEQAPLGVSYHSIGSDPWNAHPLLMNFLYDYLQNHLGSGQSITPAQLAQGGLKIYTTIDPKVQQAVHTVFWSTNYDNDFPGPTSGMVVQGGAVFLDPKTGGILGVAGSRKQGFVRFGYDRAYAVSSPGSSIKPVIDYGPAIQSGKWTPTSLLDDYSQNFNGYQPSNWNADAPRHITLQYGLTWSQNIASVWLLSQIGVQTGIQFAENDGITFTRQETHQLCTAIGCEDVSPMQMAQAYEPFDDNGVQMQGYLVQKITNANGTTIYQHSPAAKQVMTQSTATTMLRLLQDVADYGTGQGALVPNVAIGGKTGTVQYNAGQTMTNFNWVRDAWFDGVTPKMVGSIYIGYDQSSPAHHMSWVTKDPSANCAQIFGDIVKLAAQGEPEQQFAVGPFPNSQGTEYAAASLKAPLTGLAATWNASTNSVDLKWKSGLSGSADFVIQRALLSGPSGGGGSSSLQEIGQTGAITFVDPTASPGATYAYVVQAVDANGNDIGQAASVQIQVPAAATVPGGNVTNSGTPPANGTGGGPDGNSTSPGGSSTAPGTGNGIVGTGSGSGPGSAAGGPPAGGSVAGTGPGTGPATGTAADTSTNATASGA